jgi:spore maturation protein CgeB
MSCSWGNGHATTYSGLMRELVARGHAVLFLERDVPWYASTRDLPMPPYSRTELYASLEELRDRFTGAVRQADLVIVGSYVPEGVAIGEGVPQTAPGVTAFYDIDTPVTLAALQRGDCGYLAPGLIPRYALYLSFTGGPILERLEQIYGSPIARPLYCSIDPTLYYPEDCQRTYDLDFTLNITRAAMLQVGYAPSVRLFEAAACAAPVISDYWQGLETFFALGEEILLGRSPQQTLRYLGGISEEERRAIGVRARRRVLSEHTAAHRAEALESYAFQAWRQRGHALHACFVQHQGSSGCLLPRLGGSIGPLGHSISQ